MTTEESPATEAGRDCEACHHPTHTDPCYWDVMVEWEFGEIKPEHYQCWCDGKSGMQLPRDSIPVGGSVVIDRPATEAWDVLERDVWAWHPDHPGLPWKARQDHKSAIEQQAIDGRVAALVEVLRELRDAGVKAAAHIVVTSDNPDGVRGFKRICDAIDAADERLDHLTAAAAERDDRLRREGWDAALAAVRQRLALPLIPELTPAVIAVLLDRLASEGPL